MSVTSHTAPSFDLHTLVAAVCTANPSVADPGALAKVVLDQIDPHDYRVALHQSLGRYLTGYVTQHRPSNSGGAHGSGSTSATATGTGKGRLTGRSKLAGVGDLLHSREFSPHRGDWILLADATVEDLRSIALKRTETASVYAAKATWYSGVADLLATHHVNTVADLPVTVQAAVAAGTLP